MRRLLVPYTSGSRSVVTEARASIRESLRVFSQIEKHLERNKHEPQLFERLVSRDGHGELLATPSVPFHARSCGLTNSAFGSLFFSAKQLLGNAVGRLTNGSDFEQLWNNPNVLLFGLGWIGGKGSHGSSSTSLLSRYFVNAAERDVLGLEEMLTRVDGADDLPRVLFCNCTWVLNDVDILAGACESNYIKDHQFAIIKHSNDNFQCVQGYIQTSPVDDGYCLSSWQQSQSRYSDREGFSLLTMLAFTKGLKKFALANFDSASFARLFGIYETSSHGQKVLPCFSYRELEDSSIEGSGERIVCTRVRF